VILYLGTSSLVKLYVDETHSGTVRRWAGDAEILATCRVAYTEIISALDKRLKEKDLSTKDYELFVSRLEEDWNHFAVLDFDDIEAGRLVKKHALTRLDAIHLSAAKMLKGKDPSLSLCFSSFNQRLCEAASAEGLRVLTVPPQAALKGTTHVKNV
jgi:predicted nucleic acid-binding protein